MNIPDFSMTTLEAAMANCLAAVKIQVAQFNDQAKASYLTAFNNWSQNVVAGRVDNSNPPQPPNGYVIGYFTDPTNPKAQWAYPMTGSTPVCEIPPIPDAPKPYVPPVLPEPDDVRNVPPGDHMPIGYIATDDKGERWQKQSSPTPFGVAYLYRHLGKAAAVIAFAFALCAGRADAQVTVACSPEPLAVVQSLKVREMGPWGCYLRNEGTAPRTIAPEDVLIAIINLRPIGPHEALLVLNDHQAHSVPAKLVNAIDKVAKPLGPAVGAGLAILSKSNASTGLIVSVGSQLFPAIADPIVGIAQSQIPQTSPITSLMLAEPVTLPAGGTATRVVFCSKNARKELQPITVSIK